MTTKPIVRVPANLDGPMFTADGFLSDGLINFATRMGAGKSRANEYFFNAYGQSHFDTAFRTSAWFRKIVTIPTEDATREWRAWKTDKANIQRLEAEEDRLMIRPRLLQSLQWARLYGGCAIIPAGNGVLNENAARELDLDRIRQDDLQSLAVVDRYSITAGERERDPFSPYYGQPKMYRMTTGSLSQDIHPSRVIRLVGNPIPGHQYWDGWGDSIWHIMRDAVSNADAIASGIADMVPEMKLDIVKMQNFMANVTTKEYENGLMTRFQVANMLKSINNVLLLDKEDEWEQKSINWAGIPDIVDRLLTIMCGAADIPMTRMIGTSARGLNATGEGDLRNYYDMVSARQELELTPAIKQLDEIFIRSALGSRPPEVWYAWRPLYSLSEKERADTEKVYAEAFVARMNTGAFDETMLAKTELNRMIESEAYPGLEDARMEADNEGVIDPEDREAKELERMTAEADLAASKAPVEANTNVTVRRAANDKAIDTEDE